MSTTGHESETITVAGAKAMQQDYKSRFDTLITLPSAPTSSTLTYTHNNKTFDFKVGDEVRVPDSEQASEGSNGYVYYKLYDITTSGNVKTAYWDLGGSGGGGGATGKIRVDLTALVNESQIAASNLNGVTVTLTNTTDSQTVETKTWAGSQLVFTRLTPLKAYRISVSAKTGYKLDYEYQDIASLDIGGDITKTFEFSAIEYTAEMTSNQDVVGTPDADVDRTSSGVYLTGSYSYGGETITFGSNLHNGDKVRMPSDVDTSTITITSSSNVTGYSKEASVDVSNKKLIVAYSTTKVYATVSSNQSGASLSGVVTKVNGTAVTGSTYAKVPTGSSFTFTTENDLADYQKVITNNGTASGTSQTVQVAYNAELVSVSLTADTGSPDLTGVTVNIYDASDDTIIATGTGGITAQPIASGTSYYVGVTGSVANYGNPANTTPRTAASSEDASESVTLTYVYGVLDIEVSMSDNDNTDLALVTATASINSGTPQAITGTVDTQNHKKVFSVSMSPGDTYVISFGSVTGYQTPSDISGTKGSGVETKTASFLTAVYTLSSIQTTKNGSVQGSNPSGAGVTVTYTGQAAAETISVVGGSVKVPGNLTPTITANVVYGYQATVSESNGSIALSYAAHAYALSVSTNQSAHTDIAATVIRVSATGISSDGYIDYTGSQSNVEVLVPANATPTAACQSGAPTGYSESIVVDSTNKTITALYSTTIMTVVLDSDTGEADLSGVTTTVTDTTASSTITAEQDGKYKVPTGHDYSVAVSDDVDGYSAPSDVTGTASGTAVTVTMTYEEAAGFVDLGLPSGLLWSGGNLVKDSQGNYSIGEETDWGTYVSWGNIVGHNEGEGYKFDQTTYDSTTGASVSADIPSNDATHDIALATLGSPWHLPTKADFQELYDNTDTEWVADYNGTGVAGRKFMKKTDHSVYVFFPASGSYSGTSLISLGSYGNYRSSSWDSSTDAYRLSFNSSSVYPQSRNYRYFGFSVRPVQYPSSKIKFRVTTTDGSTNVGLDIVVTDKTGEHTFTTDSNGEVTGLVANGSVKISITGKVVDITQITVSGNATVNISVSPILYAYIKFDQTKSDETQMITVSETIDGAAQTLDTTTGRHANAALQAIRDSSHLYMGKYSNGTMALRQLKDDDGTKYADDNSNADMTGGDGDHFLRINAPFYIKRVSGSDSGDTVVYGVAVGGKPDSTWKQIISPDDLLGVHEAIASDTGNNTNGVLYSKSGTDSTGNISQANFKQKARNKGTGFTLVTWEWHCIMAMLFYGWYGRTNAQAQCGTGANAYSGATRYTGLKDSFGMTDTDSTNGNTDNIKFWGIENWWGCKSEWVDNVVVDARVWKVTDKDGNQRTAGTGGSTTGEIQKLLLSENLDMIPTSVVSNSSYDTYYCDQYNQSSNNSRVVARSFNNANAYGGVASVTASNDSSNMYSAFGSRLAFNGTIEQASVMKLRFKTSNDAAVAGATVTVTMPTGTESHVTDSNGEVTIFTLAGSTCTVAANGYNLNVSQFTVVAGSTVAITATELPITTGYIILDQTSSDPTTKVIDESGNTYSNYQRPAVITAIRQASHCYVGTFANDVMTLKQLSDSDGTQYADGTSASTDIATAGKDVFMRLPYFFTRVSEYATDKIKIEFAIDEYQTATSTRTPDGNGWKQWGGNDLIGKYEATAADTGNNTTGKLYSQSGQTSTPSVSQANFKQKARNNGTGFTLVKWRHQNIMAILFYAYYGHTNCQSLIGSGASSNNKQTGLKNSLGMTDTTASNGNTDNIVFWGLENWWGNKYEWVDNVTVDNGTWTITEDDGTTRTLTAGTDVMAAAGSWIYPSKFAIGDNLDVIGAVGQTGGSDSTGYCDGQYIATSSSRVVARSYINANAFGGVAFVIANSDSSNTNTYIGSRLAFTGTIEIS